MKRCEAAQRVSRTSLWPLHRACAHALVLGVSFSFLPAVNEPMRAFLVCAGRQQGV